MTSETNIVREILLAASAAGHRLFRQNVGLAWVGTGQPVETTRTRTVTMNPGDVLLRRARRFHAGIGTGSGDTIGWAAVKITPDMVGQTLPVFANVEVKTKTGRPTEDQIKWIDAILRIGGRAGIARSAEDALRILGG